MTDAGDERKPASDLGQRYGQWAAPKEDGALLIWPDARVLPERIRANVDLLASAHRTRIGGLPLPELRRAARALVGHDDPDRPLIATGHQCELHHPGVWIKNAVIAAAAEACGGGGGAALHVAVDTDAPKHLKLKWPAFAAPITDDPRVGGAAWTGLLDPPTPAHLDGLIAAAGEAVRGGQASPLLVQFLRACQERLGAPRISATPPNAAGVIASAQHELDESLGLDYGLVLLSRLLDSEPWLRFVCHIAGDAGAFARAYNAALADYRRAAGIEGHDRPMPDLAIDDRRVELPFWLDDLARGLRRRAEVVRDVSGGHALVVGAGEDGRFAFLTGPAAIDAPAQLLAWLNRHHLRLAPRALSLTMFLRLLVCDLFVHGIGGGHYDQVTDRLMRGYFGIEPPAFAVATATLYHPLSLGRERACLPCLRHEGHALAHQVLPRDQKQRWLARIAEADGFHARREVFQAMHAHRRERLLTDRAYEAWRSRMGEAERSLSEEAVLFDRELFYALQPAERLREMIARVRAAFSLPSEVPTFR